MIGAKSMHFAKKAPDRLQHLLSLATMATHRLVAHGTHMVN